ncbi:MAG: DNA-binding response regulator [Chloroflexi bacterium]|nr:DNA-binding response regulator [Chloroflexota bacterium]MDL1882751.1 response regulator transcription factor [Anaerolineae bacterium CFX8]
MSKNLRILVADDQSDVRYALRTLLQLVKELHVEVVGEAADADTLLNEVASLEPDMLLVDWKLPGLRAIAYLRALYPRLRIIVLSVRAEARQAALDAGADAFVFKGDPVERLVEAIQHVRDLHRPSTGE